MAGTVPWIKYSNLQKILFYFIGFGIQPIVETAECSFGDYKLTGWELFPT